MNCRRERGSAVAANEARTALNCLGSRPLLLAVRYLWLSLLLGISGCAGLVSSVSINPAPVKAGEDADLSVALDKAPNFDGGEIRVVVIGPVNSGAMLTPSAKTQPGVRRYRVPIHIPPTAPGGTWTISRVAFFDGMKEIPLSVDNKSFQVLARPDIVSPTSAQVVVTPSQAQLLRTAAAQLQSRIQILKADLTAQKLNVTNPLQVNEILGKRIDTELGFLTATEATFSALAAPETQPDPAASIFFTDLRVSYLEAKAQVRNQGDATASLSLVSLSVRQDSGEHSSQHPTPAQAVFRVFEQNELAYRTVADTGSLTFDLEVSTTPQGATISYRRRGDAYHQHPNQTNSVIKGLPYAIWTVRVQEPGYQDEEREHDPFRESNHVINVQLRH
jgi:hypothetical protein